MDYIQQPFAGDDWSSEFQRGLVYLRAGEFAEAHACFERAYVLHPESAEVAYALGRERLRQGDAGSAEPLLRAAWERDPSLISAAGTLARCLGLNLGRLDEAHAVLNQAELRHGTLGLVCVVRSELLLGQGRVDEARAQAERALEHADTGAVRTAASAALARVCNHEGIALAEKGAYDSALFWFKRAAHLDPEWSNPHTNMGAAFAHLGKRELARSAYERAAAMEPASPVANYNLAILLLDDGDLDGARAALERAVTERPMYADAVLALAQIYIAGEEPEPAIELVGSALEHAPDSADLWAQLGLGFAAAGQRDDAEACWRRALDLDPLHVEACRALADVLVRESRYAEAAILASRIREPEEHLVQTATGTGLDGLPR